VHGRGGIWEFDCDAEPSDDDAPGFFERPPLSSPGETVAIAEHDGVMRTFPNGWEEDL